MLTTPCCSTVLASNILKSSYEGIINKSFDTLSYTDEEYKMFAKKSISDYDRIQSTIIGYLATEKAYVRNSEEYTRVSEFVDEKAVSSKTIAYRESESEYLRKLNDLMGWTIYKDNILYSNFNVSIKRNVANASIVEDYKYYIDDDFGDESFRRREYRFEMENNFDGWKIVSVKTNDPWETEENFVYKEIDIDGTITQLKNEIEKANNAIVEPILVDNLDDKIETSATPLKKWTYSANKAVTYAASHYNDTSNSVFGFIPGRDCQNFVSQCVWAGLGGSGNSKSARPAVSTSVAGSSGQNVWQRNVATTYYSSNTYWLNWTWDNARGFANMIKVSKTTLEGPYGATHYSGDFMYTSKGNVLEVDWDGAPARDTLDHAMFVTQVSGTYGSRTTSQVKIAAHTSPTNTAYQTLSSYNPISSSAFARVIIVAEYYSTTQS